ncbi:hypothetical protein HYQ46_003822 [Verticillium longisporum]|nr:hypothetical protein HYQ46_003822 [Verticillium longisporum]
MTTLGADGGDAAEEGWARAALEAGGQGCDGDEGARRVDVLAWEAAGVELLGGGREDGRDLAEDIRVVGEGAREAGQGCGVGVPGARVRSQVLLGTKLGRVDVEGDDDIVGRESGGANESQVAGMQSAHRGHEGEGAVIAGQGRRVGAQSSDGAEHADG